MKNLAIDGEIGVFNSTDKIWNNLHQFSLEKLTIFFLLKQPATSLKESVKRTFISSLLTS